VGVAPPSLERPHARIANAHAGFAPSVAPLGALSFALHRQLAERFGGRHKWGYSKSTGTSLSRDGESAAGGSGEDWLRDGSSRRSAAKDAVEDRAGAWPGWLAREKGCNLEVISSEDSVAQLDPLRLCEFLLDESLKKGVTLYQPARVVSVSKDGDGKLSGVRIAIDGKEEVDIACSRLVITAGPWTPVVFENLFPQSSTKIPISALAGHSLLVKSPRWTTDMEPEGCHAVFATDTLGYSPELFSRLGEEVYIAGLNSMTIHLPEVYEEAKVRQEDIETLKMTATKMLGSPAGENDLQVIREALCFRPVTSSGRPIVSRIPDSRLGGVSTDAGSKGGVYIAAGHGAWGISQSLGTGKALTELMDGLPMSANISALGL